MSKQLAISSTFAIFAMACFALTATSDQAGQFGPGAADAFAAEAAAGTGIDLPRPAFFTN